VIGADHVHYHAPSQGDLGSFTVPADPRYGSQDLPFVGARRVGGGKKYVATPDDVGKLVYCQVSVTNEHGATAWATAAARPIGEKGKTDK
jgi:hypothetical protein